MVTLNLLKEVVDKLVEEGRGYNGVEILLGGVVSEVDRIEVDYTRSNSLMLCDESHEGDNDWYGEDDDD